MEIVDNAIEESKRRDAIACLDRTDIAIARVQADAVCDALAAECEGSAEIVAGLREYWGCEDGACWCVQVTL